MYINPNSVSVDGVNMGQYLVEAKFGYNKLWSQDTGRNLAGSMTGTLKGIFPKITLQFRKLTRSELETIAPILDKESQTVTYYDPTLHRMNTILTYSNDWEVTNKNIISNGRKNEGFPISFISVRKR